MKEYTDLQKQLIGALVGLARSLDETNSDFAALTAMINGINAIENAAVEDVEKVRAAKHRAVPDCSVCKNPCGKTFDYDLNDLEKLQPKISKLKFELIEKTVEYCKTVKADEKNFENVLKKLTESLFAVGYDYFTEEQLSEIIGKLSDENEV